MLASYSSVCVVLPLFVLYFKQAMEFPECVHAWFACEISENGHEYLHASAFKCSRIRSEWSTRACACASSCEGWKGPPT